MYICTAIWIVFTLWVTGCGSIERLGYILLELMGVSGDRLKGKKEISFFCAIYLIDSLFGCWEMLAGLAVGDMISTCLMLSRLEF